MKKCRRVSTETGSTVATGGFEMPSRIRPALDKDGTNMVSREAGAESRTHFGSRIRKNAGCCLGHPHSCECGYRSAAWMNVAKVGSVSLELSLGEW